MICQIGFAQMRAVLFGEGGNFLRQLAAIERFPFGLGDKLQRACLRRITEDFTGFRRAPLRCETGAKARLILEFVIAALPEMTNQRRNGKAIARILNRGLRQGSQGQRGKSLCQRHPTGDRARHRHRVPAELRHLLESRIKIRMPAGGRSSGSIKTVQLIAIPNNGESIAAYPAPRRFHHR